MEFIKPVKYKKSEIKLKDETWLLLKHYANYCNMPVDNVVDTFLQNLWNDKNFVEFIKKERDNKRIMKVYEQK